MPRCCFFPTMCNHTHSCTIYLDKIIFFFENNLTIEGFFCFTQCKPVISWLRNGVTSKQGVNMFVFEDVPMPKKIKKFGNVKIAYETAKCEENKKFKSSVLQSLKVPVIKNRNSWLIAKLSSELINRPRFIRYIQKHFGSINCFSQQGWWGDERNGNPKDYG